MGPAVSARRRPTPTAARQGGHPARTLVRSPLISRAPPAHLGRLLTARGASLTHQYHPGGHELGGPDVLKGIANFVAGLL